MNKKRVLLSTYHGAYLRPGGGEVELKELAKKLCANDLVTDIYGPNSLPLDGYDYLVHFSVHPDGWTIVEASSKMGLKIILWPNIWFREDPSLEEVGRVDGFFALADRIVFKSNAELDNVRKYVPVPLSKVLILPWGVDPVFLDPLDPEPFKKIYGLRDYVLWVGQIEQSKNQLLVIDALRDLDLPLVFLGGYRDMDYFLKCQSAAPKHFLFLPHLTPACTMLRSAYCGCSIYLEIPFEPPGISALEARILGKQLVLSKGAWTVEEFGNSVYVASPDSPDEIRAAVERALLDREVDRSQVDRIVEKHLLPKTLFPLISLLKNDLR